MHDTLTIGIPLIAIIAGILFNRSDTRDLRAEIVSFRKELHQEISGLRSEVQKQIDALRSEMQSEFREFYRTLGQHDVRLEHIEKKA